MMDAETKKLLRTFAEQLWERDTLTKSGCFGEESDAIDAALDLIEQQSTRIADLETKCRLYEASLDKADARIAELESDEKEAVPVAWMVTGGKTFVDKPFLSEANADKSIAERKDGARKVALYTHPAPASKDAIRRDALEEAAQHITNGIEQVKQNGWTDCANERLRCAAAIRALYQKKVGK